MSTYLPDIIVVAVLLLSAYFGYQKGFVKTGLSFLPMALGLIGTYLFSPVAAKILRQTPLFLKLQEGIAHSLHLDAGLEAAAMESQTAMIQGLKLPVFLQDALLSNNNPVVYSLLDVGGISEYIAGFLANICLNVMSVVLVFLVISLLVRALLAALNLVAELPILSFANRLGGVAVATLRSLFILWLAGAVLVLFAYQPIMQGLIAAIESSVVASIFFKNNLLLLLIVRVFG